MKQHLSTSVILLMAVFFLNACDGCKNNQAIKPNINPSGKGDSNNPPQGGLPPESASHTNPPHSEQENEGLQQEETNDATDLGNEDRQHEGEEQHLPGASGMQPGAPNNKGAAQQDLNISKEEHQKQLETDIQHLKEKVEKEVEGIQAVSNMPTNLDNFGQWQAGKKGYDWAATKKSQWDNLLAHIKARELRLGDDQLDEEQTNAVISALEQNLQELEDFIKLAEEQQEKYVSFQGALVELNDLKLEKTFFKVALLNLQIKQKSTKLVALKKSADKA